MSPCARAPSSFSLWPTCGAHANVQYMTIRGASLRAVKQSAWRLLAAMLCVCVAGALWGSTPSEAVVGGAERWLGPYGGSAYGFAVSPTSPDLVLVASPRGAFRSVDGGITWVPSSTGLTNLRVGGFVWDPFVPSVVYTGTPEGLFRSVDAGVTWSLAVQPGPRFDEYGDRVRPQPVGSIAASPTTPGLLYLTNTFGLHRSDDAGATWRRLRRADGWRFSLAMAASDDRRLYSAATEISTGAEKSYRSDDGGETWRQLAPPGHGSFAVAPDDPDTVFLVDVEGDVLRSTDGGDTWATVWTGALVTGFAISPSDPSRVYLAGVRSRWTGTGAFLATSNDSGVTWDSTQWFPGVPGSGVVRVSPHDADDIFFSSTDTGIRRSTDGGQTFTRDNLGFAAAPAIAVDPDPSDIARWYVSLGNAGAFRTSDGGVTWTDITDGLRTSPDPLALAKVNAFAVDAGGAVYAAAPDLRRSDDGGQTWTSTPSPSPVGRIIDLLAHPSAPGTLLATVIDFSGKADLGGVFRTTDAGQTWTETSPHDAQPRALGLGTANEDVYVEIGHNLEGTTFDDRLFSSADFGHTWQRIPGPPENTEATSVAVAGTGRIILGSERGAHVTYTDDHGATWHREYVDFTNRASDITVLAADPADPLQVFAGTSYGGTWMSRDAGASWISTTPGVYGEQVSALAFPRPFVDGDPLELRLRPALVGGSGRAGAGVALFTPRPHNIVRPSIDQTARVGRTIWCRPRRWSRTDSFAYRWARDGSFIDDARGSSYKLKQVDGGQEVSCRVRALGPGGAALRWSPAVRVPRT